MRVNSWVSLKCKASNDEVNGCGVFAVEEIAKGEFVSIFGGKIATADECDQLSKHDSYFSIYTLSLYPGVYLGSHSPHLRDDAELFNHSCDPKLAFLVRLLS